MKAITKIPIAILVALAMSACQEPEKVDTIVHNAKIYTLDENNVIAEAIAISDGKIVEVGAENQILNKYLAETKIDAQQGIIYPGFNDAHSHFLGYGLIQSQVNLKGTKSWKEVLQRISDYISNDDNEWVLGRGWDQNDWDTKEYPTNHTLDSLFPDKRIILKRVDGHALIASTNVLRDAGIKSTTGIDGGAIIKDSQDELTGVLVDEAMNLVQVIIPEPTRGQTEYALQKAEQDCLSKGLTTVTDAGLSIENINVINEMHQNDDLKIRVYAMYSADPDIFNSLDQYRIKTDRLSAYAIKVYADGALGSRGARLIETYTDDSLNRGLIITGKDSIAAWAEKCMQDSFQLCVHCIGTEANRYTLQAMGSVLGGTNDRRWRIEHAQVVHPEDRSLFREYNILPSMQPTHATSDMYWAEDRLGPIRVDWAYSLKSLKDENGMIPLGTDFPVEDISPLNTFYAAVTRKDHNDFPQGGYLFSEALSREEALRGITIWPAIAAFQEKQKGSLVAGKVADMVILNQDILTCSEDNILSTQVLETWINGERIIIQ